MHGSVCVFTLFEKPYFYNQHPKFSPRFTTLPPTAFPLLYLKESRQVSSHNYLLFTSLDEFKDTFHRTLNPNVIQYQEGKDLIFLFKLI